MPILPFKLNQDRRHHIPKQKQKVTNWREYDASLRQRGSLTVWFSDEAIEGWRAAPRTTPGGQPAAGLDACVRSAFAWRGEAWLARMDVAPAVGGATPDQDPVAMSRGAGRLR